MTIGDQIKNYRKKAGYTQKELGELSNTSERTIQQYEGGKRQPRLEQLQKIAKALDIPMVELFELKENDGITYDLTALDTPEQINSALDKLLSKRKTQTSAINKQKIIDNTNTGLFDTEINSQNSLLNERLENLINNFLNLNSLGQTEAVKRVEELTEIKKYIDKEK